MPGPRDARAFLTTATGLRKVSWHPRIWDVAAQRERVRAFPERKGHMEPAVGARARQEFAGLRFTPGSLDKKTDSLLAYACALMAG